ncbi:MAG: hypothetical protein ACOC6S_01330 [Chloroflexota bacterium]
MKPTIRELKSKLSRYIVLLKVKKLRRITEEGFASWGSGKPQGLSTPVTVLGKPLPQTVIEEREGR